MWEMPDCYCGKWLKPPAYRLSLLDQLNPLSDWLRSGRRVHGASPLAVHCLTKSSSQMDPSWRIPWPSVIGSSKPIHQNSTNIRIIRNKSNNPYLDHSRP